MIKIMRAVAAVMLLATGAQAATVSGPMEVLAGGETVPASNPVLGGLYYFNVTLEPADLLPLPAGWGSVVASRLWLTTQAQGAEQTTSSPVYGSGSVYTFSWFWKADGPADFQFVNGYLERYQSGYPSGPRISTGTDGPFIGNGVFAHSIAPISYSMRQTEPETTVVPIGGTLPLMLSALGLGALVLRRQAQRAAA